MHARMAQSVFRALASNPSGVRLPFCTDNCFFGQAKNFHVHFGILNPFGHAVFQKTGDLPILTTRPCVYSVGHMGNTGLNGTIPKWSV